MYLRHGDLKNYWVCDIEADGLDPSHVWCAVAKNCATKEVWKLRGNQEVKRFIEEAPKGTIWVGHNFLSFDAPVCNRLLGTRIHIRDIVDTLVLSFLYNPHLERDHEIVGRRGHSLKAWALRMDLAVHKDEFNDFSQFSEELLERCASDVEINYELFLRLTAKMRGIGYSEESCEIEHEIRHIINKQQLNGWFFDIHGAEQLSRQFRQREADLTIPIQELFPPTLVPVKTYTYKEKADGTPYQSYSRHVAGYPSVVRDGEDYVCWDWKTFNLGSPKQRVEKLLELGWIPQKFGKISKKMRAEGRKVGNPQVDEDSLMEAAEEFGKPELKMLAEWLVVNARGNMCETWLKWVNREDSRMHGNINSCGALSRRMTHNDPNCVPLYSQALTRDGWKYYNELTVGDDILAYDMNTKTKKWTPLLAVSSFPAAEVYSFGQKHPGKRLYCTENHSWVVRPRNGVEPEKLVEARHLKHNRPIRINAPFENDVTASNFSLIQEKYERDWAATVCKLSSPELNAMMQGFLLADGCRTNHGTRWAFAQAEGPLLDAFLTCLYLISNTRISACTKCKLKGPNQRMGYNVLQTSNTFMRTKNMSLKYEGIEPVWCPTTVFGTWVMKQGDFITITGNTSNIPSNDAKYGKEMRGIWRPTPGLVQVGYDAKGIQMRLFGHFCDMYRKHPDIYETYLGDPHTGNAALIGQGETRRNAKNHFYAFIFGAQAPKLGKMVGKDRAFGEYVTDKLFEAAPGLKEATENAKSEYRATGRLRCLDGGFVNCTGEHAAFNYQVQPAEAVIMKKSAIFLDKRLKEAGVWHRKIGDNHDEGQHECAAKDAPRLGEIACQAIRDAGEHFNLRVPMDGSYLIGTNWSETH